MLYKLHFFSALLRTVVITESSMPKINAHRKPSILMPDTNLSASSMISTLMTRRNNPNVIIVTGSVKIIISGFTIKLSTANTKEKIIAVANELIATYGLNIFEIMYTATAVIRIFTLNLIIIFLKANTKILIYCFNYYHLNLPKITRAKFSIENFARCDLW